MEAVEPRQDKGWSLLWPWLGSYTARGAVDWEEPFLPRFAGQS